MSNLFVYLHPKHRGIKHYPNQMAQSAMADTGSEIDKLKIYRGIEQ